MKKMLSVVLLGAVAFGLEAGGQDAGQCWTLRPRQ